MATLNNQPICVGDSVYDVCDGPGTIQAIDCNNRIHVSFSAGRPRQYSENGMTGKRCNRTLFNGPPAIIEFPRDECNATKLSHALDTVMDIFEDLTKVKSCEPEACPCECQVSPCECFHANKYRK